jgi:hypothetical protein
MCERVQTHLPATALQEPTSIAAPFKRAGAVDDVSRRAEACVGKVIRRLFKVAGSMLLVAMLGLCGFVNLVNAPDKADRDRQARGQASRLIAGLGDYRAEQGRYPAALEELVPRFVSEIPSSASGGGFEYAPIDDGREFELGYFEAPMGVLPSDGFNSYESRTASWRFEVL